MNRDLGQAPIWLFEEKHKSNKWTPEENKRFESALAMFDQDTPDRWHIVASMIPGKTVHDVINQYRELVEDITDIEAGRIPVPGYINKNHISGFKQFYGYGEKRASSSSSSSRSSSNLDHERKKGVPWTEEEHRQFLLGLKKYGKGDWRNIARNFVTTRTPTQVASHAQKYFIRQHSVGKDKRRSSIHDITMVSIEDNKLPENVTAVVYGGAAMMIRDQQQLEFTSSSRDLHLGHHRNVFPMNPTRDDNGKGKIPLFLK